MEIENWLLAVAAIVVIAYAAWLMRRAAINDREFLAKEHAADEELRLRKLKAQEQHERMMKMDAYNEACGRES